MKEVIHYDENNKRVVDQEFKPKVVEGIFKPETMAEMRAHLEAVCRKWRFFKGLYSRISHRW